MKNKIIGIVIGLLSASTFAAGNSSANLNANATLNSSCKMSTSDIGFGDLITTTSENKVANGGLTILCSKNIIATIAVIGGNQTAVTAGNTRYMTGTAGNTDKLYYGLFRPAGYGPGNSAPGQWGNLPGTPQNHILVDTTGQAQNLSFPVRLNTFQNVRADNYSDTLTFQITY